MQARAIAQAGVGAALLAVSAQIMIPFGAVPFTLQTLMLAALLAALGSAQATVAVGMYLLLGTLGLPVFSGLGSGVAALAGPTGGFLWGFLLGMLAAHATNRCLSSKTPMMATTICCSAVLLGVSYICGTFQLMMQAHMTLGPALTVAVLPFVVPDIVKLVVGARVGCAVARARGVRLGV